MASDDEVLVVGGSGHALVAIEVLRATGHRIAGALTREGRPTEGLRRIGVDVLGTDGQLAERIADASRLVFIAVGDNRDRCRLSHAALDAGASLVPAISPHAVVSDTADVAPGALVMPGVVVNALTTVGVGAIVNTRASIDHECSIAAFAHVAPGVTIAGDVTIGEGALVGVGANVLPGRTIGAWAIVGAGAVVTRDVASEETVAGVPARPRT